MRATGPLIHEWTEVHGIAAGIARALLLGLAAALATGCGAGSEESAGSPAELASPTTSKPEARAETPQEQQLRLREARRQKAIENGTSDAPDAYAGLDLGFPGCADGKCPQQPDSTFIPTPEDIVEKMLELARVERDDLVYDLGSGDGRSVIAAARIYGTRSVGVELNPQVAEVARERVAQEGMADLVEIRTGDMFDVDLSSVDVLVLYQPPSLLERMKPQLYQLAPGARIVSHMFLIPGVEPDESRTLASEFTHFTHKIHLWNAPIPRSDGAAEADPS